MAIPKEPGSASAIEQVLARLAARSPELDKLDDDIGRLIVRVETALRALKLGMRLSVQIRDDGDIWAYLAFQKVNATWRLVVESGLWADPDTRGETPLSDCDRETRLAAFRDGTIEQLLLTAADQLDEAIKERETALETGKQFVDAVEEAAKRRGGK